MNIYTSFVLFSAFIIIEGKLDQSLLNPEMKELFENLHKTCIEKHNINTELIEKANNGEFVEDPEFKCYTQCLLKETEVLKENGSVDVSQVNKILPEPLKAPLTTVLIECGKRTANEEDLCQRAFNIFKCSYEMDPEHAFLV